MSKDKLPPMKNVEEWKSIADWEGHYEVSNLGRIKSLRRTITYVDGRKKVMPERILASAKGGSDYLMVALKKGGRQWTVTVHRLVALAFLGNRPDGCDIHHADGNKANNRASNLVWMPKGEHRSDHMQASIAAGAHPATKIPDEIIKEIREIYATRKYTQRSLSIMFGISNQHISRIVNHQRRVSTSG